PRQVARCMIALLSLILGQQHSILGVIRMLKETPTYSDTLLLINGQWDAAEDGDVLAVKNPATGETIGYHAHAKQADLDAALEAADTGFKQWREVPANKRSAILKKAASLLRERASKIAVLMTMEQGKPLA